MKIAIEGCAHGELEIIYNCMKNLEEKKGIKVDLLICCGDFQASRNMQDLNCMAVPKKYRNICTFYKYYNGEKVAPVLTIFIGGNHEASNYLQELPYGGWVAPNIYYLGYAGVVNIAGIRIAGLSGIYKGQDYLKGHFEKLPYDNSSIRSIYHIRNLEVFRLKQLSQPIDIFLSHDWPTGIWNHGNINQLLRFKPYFKSDIESGKLGSGPCEDLLNHFCPKFYFAAHLHCKFSALVQHANKQTTKFLALDKCLPKKRFLQIIEVPQDSDAKIELKYDLEWLTILSLTNHLLNVKNVTNYMPGNGCMERWQFTPTNEEKEKVLAKFSNNLVVPNNFVKTAEGYDIENPNNNNTSQPLPQINSQTVLFTETLEIDDPLVLLNAFTITSNNSSENLEVGVNNSTSLDSKLYETFHESSPFKLSLPKPKFDQIDLSNSNDNAINENVITVCNDNDMSVPDSSSIAETTPEGVSPKIFKRRNASFYTNTS